MYSSLSNEQQAFLFKLYQMLRGAPLSAHGRYRTFETAAVDLQPWHIDSISLKALEQLVTNGNAKGLRRGHRLARKARADHMFDEGVFMSQEEMLSFFYKNDVVTVITAEENAQHGEEHWSMQIPVPRERLKGGSYSLYTTKSDVAWAVQEYATYLASQVEEDLETR